jgi:hypothetical protein
MLTNFNKLLTYLPTCLLTYLPTYLLAHLPITTTLALHLFVVVFGELLLLALNSDSNSNSNVNSNSNSTINIYTCTKLQVNMPRSHNAIKMNKTH